MTENEAIEYMKNEVRCIKQASHCDRDCLKCSLVKEEQPLLESFAVAIQALEEIQQYRAIGTVEEFKALKEKSVAKKPIRNDLCTCPSCGTHNEIIKKRRNTVAFDTVYCWHCGQAIAIKRD